MSKQYKNVYTILEKAKKGELDTYYKEKEGLFGKLDFYKRSDLIEPYVHYIDEDKITNIIEAHVLDQQSISNEYKLFSQSTAFKKLNPGKQPSMDDYYNKVKENYGKIPEHLRYDIYKMYYHRMKDLEFSERTDKNRTKFKFLESSNNPVGKIMSEGSSLKSSIFTRNMMMYYLLQLTEMNYIDPENAQNISNGLQGNSEFDDQQGQQAMDDMMNQQRSKNMLDRMMKDAQETCKNIDDHLDKETQERLFDNPNEHNEIKGEAGQFSEDYFRTIIASLSQINLSMGSLKEKIKKLLDKTTSYFSARKTIKYEDLFNSDNIGGIEEYELLHPKLRKIMIDDILIKDIKSIGKVDVYVDISGSMGSSCGVHDVNNLPISKMNFAKSFIAKLKELEMLNDVYLFDTKVRKYRNDLISIAMIDCGGGTTTDNAIKSIINNGNNALVITDAEDRCSIYSEKAFFIGVEGANFGNFTKAYLENQQCIVFNGKTVRIPTVESEK